LIVADEVAVEPFASVITIAYALGVNPVIAVPLVYVVADPPFNATV
jgi:hypothetical protein